MKRDAPFEPIDGDFDKFIQELHKNSAHNAAINKKLAEQKLNGGTITLESPQQSFNKIRQQHKNTMSSITSGINECSQQITQASCAHNMFDNSASFGSNNASLANSSSFVSNNTSTASTNNNFGNYQNNNVRKTAPRSVAKETKTRPINNQVSNIKRNKKVPNPVFGIFGIFCLFIFLLNGSPVEGMIFFAMMIGMQILSLIISNRKK